MKLKASLESALKETPSAVMEPSEEETVLQIEEVAEGLVESNQLLAETDRIEDVREGLINMGNVISTMESAGPHHLALMQIAGNLATAGSGKSSELLFPNLESYEGTRVNLESLSETAARLWARIMAALKRVLEMFAKFWDSVFNATNQLTYANNRLKARAKAIHGRSIRNGNITLNTERKRLEINNAVVPNGSVLIKGLTILRSNLKVVLDSYVSGVLVAGSALANAAGHTQLTPEEYLMSHIEAANKIDFRSIGSLLNVRNYVDARFSPGEVQATMPMLGNRTLFVHNGQVYGNAGSSHLAQAESVRGRRIGLAASSTRPATPNDPIEIQTFDAKTIDAICGEVEAILKLVATFSSGGKRKDLAKTCKTLMDATDHAQKSLYATNTTESAGSHYRAASRFSSAFSAWAQNPHDAFCTHALSVCRAAIAACNKSVAAHG